MVFQYCWLIDSFPVKEYPSVEVTENKTLTQLEYILRNTFRIIDYASKKIGKDNTDARLLTGLNHNT